jgi:hypothetical protein
MSLSLIESLTRIEIQYFDNRQSCLAQSTNVHNCRIHDSLYIPQQISRLYRVSQCDIHKYRPRFRHTLLTNMKHFLVILIELYASAGN